VKEINESWVWLVGIQYYWPRASLRAGMRSASANMWLANARHMFAYTRPLGDIILGAVITAARRPGGLHKTNGTNSILYKYYLFIEVFDNKYRL
jgi:hypothetical protein